MNTSHNTLMAACLFMLLSSTAFSQSSGIAWKNGNVLTAQKMQQLDNAKMNVDSLGKPGFAPKLNDNGQITNPVVGDVSAASVQAPGGVARTLSARAGDVLNVKDYGAAMAGSSSDEAIISSLFAGNTSGAAVVIPGGTWPDGSFTPSAVANTKFVNVNGYLNNRPALNLTEWNLGLGIPYFGNGVVSLEHGTQYDGPATLYSRVNTGGLDNSYHPMVGFYQANDTVNTNTQGGETVDIKTVTTPNSTGYADGLVSNLYSMGNNYWGSFDVNHWSHTQNYGTNWVWDNLQEMYDFVPFECPTGTDHNLCTARYMNEEDIGGTGPEQAGSAYDPTLATRKMFWLTTNHNAPASGTGVTWKANTTYLRYQMVVSRDAFGRPYMFVALPTNYTAGSSANVSAKSGSVQPEWVYTTGSTITDGGITWTCLGPYHYDLGAVFAVGGDNDPSKGWIERIGTLMTEQTDYIYNALFDFSKAAFDPNVPVKVFSRIQPDVYLDLSAQGTAASQNQNLFGYSGTDSALEYRNAKNGLNLRVTDTGVTSVQGYALLGTGSGANLSGQSYPGGSATIVGYNLHGGAESDVISNLQGLSINVPNSDNTISGAGQLTVTGLAVTTSVPLTVTGALTASASIITPAAFASLPSSPNAGEQEYCSDCYSASNSSGTKGIPVWWNYNVNAWTDALGQPVLH